MRPDLMSQVHLIDFLEMLFPGEEDWETFLVSNMRGKPESTAK